MSVSRIPSQDTEVPGLRNVTLEVSLKPFGKVPPDGFAEVCRLMFRQWEPLTRYAETVSVMMWPADGSEILQYTGDLGQAFDWSRYIGHPNPKEVIAADPNKECLHSRCRLYMDDPPVFTYRLLGQVVATIRQVGREMLGKPIRVGATFDSGGEFAVSDFKYKRHPEICLANTSGDKSFVGCYAVLHGDRERYAGFPDGIAEGTPFGTFFGRQCHHFCKDTGFDFIWFSNGFGFGLETWKTTGPMFDGEIFDGSQAGELREKILSFWRDFRAECDLPIETRGTNLGTGTDLASDAVPLRDLYRGGLNIITPPNSPWAALNGDFGLELVGYMGRIVETASADGRYPFRFYVHDPWWLNSPWLDRYGRYPHDIYLPLAVSRIDGEGRIRTPDSVAILTVDDSLGRMPEQCPREVIPHVMAALNEAPDAPGPAVWAYPFDEFHDRVFAAPSRLDEPFFNDWLMRAAVNNGLAVNTVVSTTNFITSRLKNQAIYRSSIVTTFVPDAGSPMNDALFDHVRQGGRALVYGPIGHADARLLEALGLRQASPLSGEMTVDLRDNPDVLIDNIAGYPRKLMHRANMCAGGMDAVAARGADVRVLAEARQGGETRVASLIACDPAWQGGAMAYVRGTNANRYTGGHLLTPDDPTEWFAGDLLMRFALGELGCGIAVAKHDAAQRNPVTTISRYRNAFCFSGYVPDTTVELRLRFAAGAPLLTDMQTQLIDGQSCHRFERAWRKECRVFVEQDQGLVSCTELVSSHFVGLRRRLLVTGLRNATVRFYAEPGCRPVIQLDPVWPYAIGPYAATSEHDDAMGRYVKVEDVSVPLNIAW
ncbi:MAG: hypothetical protein ACYC26_09330 [Phycisphaerales bacterium]